MGVGGCKGAWEIQLEEDGHGGGPESKNNDEEVEEVEANERGATVHGDA